MRSARVMAAMRRHPRKKKDADNIEVVVKTQRQSTRALCYDTADPACTKEEGVVDAHYATEGLCAFLRLALLLTDTDGDDDNSSIDNGAHTTGTQSQHTPVMSADQQLAVARLTRGESTHLSKTARQVVPPFLQKLYE